MTQPQPLTHDLRSEPRPYRWGACFGLHAMAAVLVTAMGCGPDPAGKYDEFLDETKVDRDVPPQKLDVATGAGDISGQFLFAVSTTVDISKPFQFIATNTVTTDDAGVTTMRVELQPLSLTQGKTTEPREPVGDPLVFTDIPVVDGRFLLDAGEITLVGSANPITGSDIVATLKMTGNILGDAFYCGSVTGDVVSPLQLNIDGSTFAAERLEDPSVLPTNVQIDCEGATVTDA